MYHKIWIVRNQSSQFFLLVNTLIYLLLALKFVCCIRQVFFTCDNYLIKLIKNRQTNSRNVLQNNYNFSLIGLHYLHFKNVLQLNGRSNVLMLMREQVSISSTFICARQYRLTKIQSLLWQPVRLFVTL